MLSSEDHVFLHPRCAKGIYNRVRGLGKTQVATTRVALVADIPMNPVHMVSFLPCCFCVTTGARTSLSEQRTAHSHSSPKSCYFSRALSVSHLQSLRVCESMPSIFFFSFWKFLNLERIYFSSCFYQRNPLSSPTLFSYPSRHPGILPSVGLDQELQTQMNTEAGWEWK